MALSPHTRRVTSARREHRDTHQGPAAARAVEQAAGSSDAVREAQAPEDLSDLLEPLERPRPSKLKIAATAWRAWRAYKKGKVSMSRPISTPILQSKTTQDVAAGAVTAGGAAGGIIAAARAVFGDYIPWDPSLDGHVAIVGAAILTPLFSRIVALFRRGSV